MKLAFFSGAFLASMLLGTGCVRDARSSGENSPATPAPRLPAPAPPATVRAAAADSGPCAAASREIEALHEALPQDLQSTPLSVKEVAQRVAELRDRSEEFLADCPSGPGRPDVECILAQILFTSFNRSVHAGEAEPLALAGRALELLASAAAAAPPGWKREADCRAYTAHFLMKRALLHEDPAKRAADLAAARDVCLKLLASRPDYPERDLLHGKIADAYRLADEHQKARAHLEAAFASEPALRWSVELHQKHLDALTGCGDLNAMEDSVLRRQQDYAELLKSKDVSAGDRVRLENWLDLSEFWLGHILFAAGKPAAARVALRRHIADIEEKEALLKEKNRDIWSVAVIYRDFKSRDLLEFIDDFLGKKPSMDFELGDLWRDDRRVTLKSSRGKVVAAVFRSTGEVRSAAFLKGVDALWKAKRGKGLEALVVGFIAAGTPASEQLEAFRLDLSNLQVEMPGGMDPGPEVFEAMHAFSGLTTSFVAFDRAGRMAWYLPDPRPIDVGLTASVLERLLAEPAPAP